MLSYEELQVFSPEVFWRVLQLISLTWSRKASCLCVKYYLFSRFLRFNYKWNRHLFENVPIRIICSRNIHMAAMLISSLGYSSVNKPLGARMCEIPGQRYKFCHFSHLHALLTMTYSWYVPIKLLFTTWDIEIIDPNYFPYRCYYDII